MIRRRNSAWSMMVLREEEVGVITRSRIYPQGMIKVEVEVASNEELMRSGGR